MRFYHFRFVKWLDKIVKTYDITYYQFSCLEPHLPKKIIGRVQQKIKAVIFIWILIKSKFFVKTVNHSYHNHK